MNKNKTSILLIALFSICLLLSGCCSSCFNCKRMLPWVSHRDFECPFVGCFMKAPHCALKNKEKLSLSPEQEAKIKELSEKTKKDSIQLKTEAKKVVADIKTKIKSEEDFDAAGINSLIDKKFELKKERIKLLINSHAELLNILTPEQKAQFKQIMKDCKKSRCCGCKGKSFN